MMFIKKSIAVIAICLAGFVSAQHETINTDPKGCNDAVSALSFCANLLDSTGLHIASYPSRQFDNSLNSFVSCFCGSAKNFPKDLQVTTCSALEVAAGNRTGNVTPYKACTTGRASFFQVWQSLGSMDWEVQLSNNKTARTPFRAANGQVLSSSNSAYVQTSRINSPSLNQETNNSVSADSTHDNHSEFSNSTQSNSARRRGESLSFYMSAGTALIVMTGFMFA